MEALSRENDMTDDQILLVNHSVFAINSGSTSPFVLLDNQTGRSVFCNKEFLKDVNEIETIHLGGVDKSQPAMKITAAGSFFEHLVGWSPHAAANILSYSRLHDDTQHFITSMHNDIDAYSVIVRSTGQIFWFKRSIRMADGTMSPHYVCNFVDAMRNPEFVNTNAVNFGARASYSGQKAAGDGWLPTSQLSGKDVVGNDYHCDCSRS